MISLEKELDDLKYKIKNLEFFIFNHFHEYRKLYGNLDYETSEARIKVKDPDKTVNEPKKDDKPFDPVKEVLALFKSYDSKTFCLGCGYSGDDIQGEFPDLYRGYGCPKCKSPLVVKCEKVAAD